jgi:hypothetical protein
MDMKRAGRKSAAQTIAPATDRFRGSLVNPKGSAASARGNIVFSPATIKSIKTIIENSKVSLPTAKAVVRRGFGAYSVSHRPNVSRSAWGLARLKQFIRKSKGLPVKQSYTQDDDLL